jgi:prepilin-type N-terminal cleavage/methylation domain-containing protein
MDAQTAQNPRNGYRPSLLLMKNNQRGFSLLELMIVVAIILIIATVAIPSLLRSRQSANETHAVANLKTLNTAEVQYSSTLSEGFGSVPDLITAGLVPSNFAYSSGYDFVVTLSADTLDYTATATARGPSDGRFDYYTRPDYVIRYSTNATRAPQGLTGEPVR